MSESTTQVDRFSAVQVYVHFLMALAILVLFLTGTAITFSGHVGWLVAVVGYQNIVLIHIVAGVTLFITLLYFIFYLLTGLATGDVPTAWMPTPGTVREAITYAKHILGRGEEPRPGKYTWIQKSEMLIIAVELTVLTLTGLVLMFPGLLLRYRPSFLVASDLHAVFAFTLLMGVTFHLYDTHVLEFPLDTSVFTGTVSLERAREEWAGWVDDEGTRTDGGETGTERHIQIAGVVVVLFTFAVIYSGVMIDRILAPVPGTQVTLYLLDAPETILEGSFGLFWGLGLNVAMLVIIAGLVGLLYGITIRVTD
ncbi:cytochrome b/b6 domain-containing protein [Halodesulfurarchaeum sp.]|uniref:cytochrome b/b6 domain-containing protein n=1 Tax=Halodesulfurarchaeum sp. TaxID=1980530 RepID=UPI002FC2A10D